MREATDICYVCNKVESTPSMTYVNIDDPHDDRLICNDCGHVDLWDEQEKLANECGQRSKPKYRVERYGIKTKGPGFKKVIWLE